MTVRRSCAWSLAMSLAASALGCANFHLPFGRSPAPEARATPAASPISVRPLAPDLPVALANEDDSVVRIVSGSVTCSGTLVDEALVLTAHHCVSQRDNYGEYIARDVRPTQIRVELGGGDLPWGEVGVRAIVAPTCGYAGGVGDVAVLVLDRKLVGVATVEPRLDQQPRLGEELDPVGFGRCALETHGIHREQRSGSTISSVHSTRFRMQAAICPGDSGGPALSREQGEVVGVISASVMDGDESTVGRSEFTRVDAWRAVFANARLVADGQSQAELPPIDGCPAEAP